MTALDGDDFNEVTELIDVYSFADGYILDEIMHCVDVNFSSFYMYKDKGGNKGLLYSKKEEQKQCQAW